MTTLTRTIEMTKELEKRLEALGYTSVDAETHLNYTDSCRLRVKLSYFIDNESKFETFLAYDTDPLLKPFEDANAYIDQLPAIEEARTNDFLAQLGRTIDRAAELDIPMDYVTPLKTTLAAMTENLLTDRRSQAERNK